MSAITDKWIKLFNNVNNSQELDTFLKNVSGKGLNEWEQLYNDYDESKDLFIEEALEQGEWMLYTPQQRLKTRINWLDLYKPLCYKYVQKIYSIVETKNYISDKQTFIEGIETYFFEICMNISYRTVVLEINDLRRNSKLLGESSEDRYKYYIDTLLRDKEYIVDFYKRYPMLYEVLDQKLKNISFYIQEILNNLEDDIQDIQNYFKVSNLQLSKINFNAGDTHSKGKTVCILNFKDKDIVYKPRNMILDVNLKLFAEEFEKTFGISNTLFIPKTLTKKGYSYVEMIEIQECSTLEDVKIYFENMGKILAFLHLFGAKDYHGENVLASGRFPYLIDNETILHFSENEIINTSIHKMYDFVANSVYSTGILPMTLYSINNNKGMEIGALNSGARRESPYLTHQLSNVGTDEIRIEKVFKEVGSFPSTVRYEGENVSCSNYLPQVQQGFEEIYRIFVDNKSVISKMIKKYFNNCETRYIYRNTNIYVQLLETSHHPELLKNRYDFEMYFLRLCEYGDISNEFDSKMIHDEINQLKNDDVPIFYSDSSNNNISNGVKEYILSLEGESIVEKILNRIKIASTSNLVRQKRIINMSFMGTELFVKNIEPSKRKDLGRELFVKRLLSSRFEHNGEISWLAMLAMDKNYDISPMKYDLYSGTAGILLGINSLKIKELEELFPGVMKYTVNYIKDFSSDITYQNVGAFTGIYGYLYALCVLKESNKDIPLEIETCIFETIFRTKDIVSNLDNLDIIGGISGILGVLLKVNSTFKGNLDILNLTDKLMKLIVQRLLKIYAEEGVWISEDPGYAHGNYGVIVQLYKYSLSLSTDSNIRKMIIQCVQDYLRKEREELNPNKVLKVRKNAKYYSWCNGIVGIVKAKHYLLINGLSDKLLSEEVEYYSRDILINGLNLDNSICHGNVGNLVILDSILPVQTNQFENEIHQESNQYLLEKMTYETDDWGVLTGEMGILMANYKAGRKCLNELLLLN